MGADNSKPDSNGLVSISKQGSLRMKNTVQKMASTLHAPVDHTAARKSTAGYATDPSRRSTYYRKPANADMMVLNVDVVEAKGLRVVDHLEKLGHHHTIRSFVELSMGSVVHITSVYGRGGSQPVWKEVFCFPPFTTADVMNITMYEKTNKGQKVVGSAKIEMSEKMKSGEIVDKWFVLMKEGKRGSENTQTKAMSESNIRGEVRLILQYAEKSNFGNYRRPPSVVCNDQKHNLDDIFEWKGEIGTGQYSYVRKGRPKDLLYDLIPDVKNHTYAIKVVTTKDQKFVRNLVLKEIDILSVIDHPNCVVLRHVVHCKGATALVLKLVKGPSLYHRLKTGSLPTDVAKDVIQQATEALSYLHSKSILHRNIKPENFVFKSDEEGDNRVVIVDFGISAFFNENKYKLCNKRYGSFEYYAPELAEDLPYDEKVDMWALGVLTYTCLCGFNPFEAETEEEVYVNIMNVNIKDGPEWQALPPAAKDFIKSLLTADPTSRMSADNALKHSWLTGSRPPPPPPPPRPSAVM